MCILKIIFQTQTIEILKTRSFWKRSVADIMEGGVCAENIRLLEKLMLNLVARLDVFFHD